MSLLSDAMEACVLYTKTAVPDGDGGFEYKWVKGVEFQAAITFDTSIISRLAEKQGVTSHYTVTTQKNASLQFHDVFQRVRDGKVFRVTSDGDDKYTPTSANLNMRIVTAEEWSFSND